MYKLKVVLLILTVLFSCFYLPQNSQASVSKLGYIDIAAVFDGYDKTKEEDAKLGVKSQSKQAERNKMVESIRNMRNELELLSEAQKDIKQAQIDDQIRRLQDLDREGNAQLQRERDDMVRVILKDIETVVNEYAAKNNYTMILNSRVLEYSLDQYNITKEVLNVLNSKYRKSSR